MPPMTTKTILACAVAFVVGLVVGGYAVNLAGYETMRGTVEEGIREMRARALAGDEVAEAAFRGLIDYVHSGAESVYFDKRLHIYDDEFWTL